MRYFIVIFLAIFFWGVSFYFPFLDSENNEIIKQYDNLLDDLIEINSKFEYSEKNSFLVFGTSSAQSRKSQEENDSKKNNKEEITQKAKIKKNKNSLKTLPLRVRLKVDFTSQAPERDWGYPWQEACEEAAVLIVMRYFDGRGIRGKDDAKKALLEIINWEKETWGFYKDSSATTTAKIITDFYGYKKVKIVANPTLNQIKNYLFQGSLIIFPAAGRNLKNPYFTPPGPLYHNLVITGYDDAKKVFYTNDPGIMSGKNFQYSYQNLLRSLADWDYQKKSINLDRKVIIVVGP